MRSTKSMVFVRCVVDNVSSIDVKLSDYLTRFYDRVFVLGYFNNGTGINRRAKPVRIHVKHTKIPFLQGFIISLIAYMKLARIKPNVVLWSWGCFFPGGLLLRLTYPYTRVFIDIRSHPVTQKSKFVTAMYNALFAWTLKIAEAFIDGFTIISPSMWIYINKRFGIKSRKKICNWSSGFDEELFGRIRSVGKKYLGRLRKTLGVEERHKVMTYYGTITYSRLPLFKLLIETVNLLRKDHRDVKLLIIGKGDAVPEVRRLIYSLNLKEHVLLIPAVPHDIIPLMLMISDLIITPFPREHNWLTQVPLKVIEALGMGKPVLTTPLIELKKILPPEYLVDYDELAPETLKSKVETLLYSNIQRDIQINISELSWDAIAEKLHKCIEE